MIMTIVMVVDMMMMMIAMTINDDYDNDDNTQAQFKRLISNMQDLMQITKTYSLDSFELDLTHVRCNV